MGTDKYLFTFLFGFFASIAFSSAVPLPLEAGVFIFCIAAVLVALSRRGLRFGFVALFLFGASLGLIRFSYAEHARFPAENIPVGTDGKANLSGVIIEEPKEEEEGTKLVVKLDGEYGKLYVTTGAYSRYEYGDRLSLVGKIDLAKDRESGEIAPIYHDIFFLMFQPQIEKISSGNSSKVLSAIFSIKHRFMEAIASVVPEPYASFGSGITIGARSGLPDDLKELFNRTSTSHLVAISGYNLTLVADFVFRAVAFFSIALAPYVSIFALLLFVLLAGASGATLRAAVMSLLLIYARKRGRLYDATRAICATAFLLALWKPHIIFFDLSFQLSLLATVGIIYVAPLFEARIKKRGVPGFFAEIAAGTIAAELLVFPLILYSIGSISLVGFPTNMLVLPFMGAAMTLLFLTGFLGLISSLLAAPFGFLAYVILRYQVSIISFFGSLSFASYEVEQFPFALLFLVYAVIFLWVRRMYRKKAELEKLASIGISEESLEYEIIEDEVPR